MRAILLLSFALLCGSCTLTDPLPEEALTTLMVDVSEVAAVGAVEPVNGVTSAGQPSEETLRVFKDSGYAAVIDLRGVSEDRGIDEQDVVEELGMSYVPFPIVGSDAINFGTAERLNTLIEAQDGPVLIHCGSGNRVGAMLALIESLKGAEDDAAIAAGKEGGLTRLESVVRERLSEGNVQ